MICCPHCGMGMLWGIYLDLTPEMKAGQAEWIACEAPEAEAIINCPACQKAAGTYQKLFAADSDGRKQLRAQEKSVHLGRISYQELPRLELLGIQFAGNYERIGFLKDAWEKFSEVLETLRKERLFNRSFLPEDDETPKAVGLRLHDPETTKAAELEYIAALPILPESEAPQKLLQKLKERLIDPEFLSGMKVRFIKIPAGAYAVYDFSDRPENISDIHKSVVKDWQETAGQDYVFTLDTQPTLELYPLLPESWPPGDSQSVTLRYCIPLAQRPAVASANVNYENTPSPQAETEEF